MNNSEHQLEFISLSKQGRLLIGTSNLINSTDWIGHLWYFPQENNLTPGYIHENDDGKHVLYPLPFGVACGQFLANEEMLVGNDAGLIAIYQADQEESSEKMMIFNRAGRVEHDRSVLSLSTHKTNKTFLSGGMDCCVKIWDAETFMPKTSYDQAHTDYVTFVGFVDDNSTKEVFVSTSLDGSCLLWDCRKQTPAQTVLEGEELRLTHAEWFCDNENLLFLGCDTGTIRLIDVRNPGKTVYVKEFSRGQSINTLRSFIYNSKKYLSACGDLRMMKVYQCNEELTEIYKDESHLDYVRDMAWLPDSKTLLSCSWDSKVIKHDPFKLSQGDIS